MGIKSVPGADVMSQSKITLGLGHVASIKVKRRKAIIARKELLRLAHFPCHLNCLIVTAGGEFRLAMALINLPEHNQRHSEMLALIQRPVEFDRLFGSRHALLGTSVRVGATSDSKVCKKTRLKAEIADTTRDIEAAPAHLYGSRRVDYRVEHTEISVTAAGCVEKAGGFGGNTFGVESLRSGASGFESGSLIQVRRHGSSVGKSLLCPPPGRRMISHAKREVAALLQQMRPIDRRVHSFEQCGCLGVMRLRLVSFAGVP